MLEKGREGMKGRKREGEEPLNVDICVDVCVDDITRKVMGHLDVSNQIIIPLLF